MVEGSEPQHCRHAYAIYALIPLVTYVLVYIVPKYHSNISEARLCVLCFVYVVVQKNRHNGTIYT